MIRISDKFKSVQNENESKLKDNLRLLWDERFHEFDLRKSEILSTPVEPFGTKFFLTDDYKFGVDYFKTRFYIIFPNQDIYLVAQYIASCLSKEGFLFYNIFPETYNGVKSTVISFDYQVKVKNKCSYINRLFNKCKCFNY